MRKKIFTEAIKLKDSELRNLSYHQERVNNTTLHFYGTKIDLSGLAANIPESAKNGLYKYRLVYTDRIESIEIIPYSVKAISNAGIICYNESIDYNYKYEDRQILNHLRSYTDLDDIIIVRNGFVTDSFACNLVFESAEGLFTPDTYLLPGTKRKFLLNRNIIHERRITVDDICFYDKLHFINAMIEPEDNVCIPVSSISFI